MVHVYGLAGSVNDQIEPLIEDHQAPGSVGNIGKRDVAGGIAWLQAEGLAVRVAECSPATGVAERLVIETIAEICDVAGIELLAWRPILVQVRDLNLDGIAGRAAGEVRFLPSVDDLRIRHTHEHVITTWSVFLEVSGLSDFDERVKEVTAVQRICLQPLFAIRFAPRSGVNDDAKSARHEVLYHERADEWREGYAVRLEPRADDDDANGLACSARIRDGTRIESGEWIERAVQGVGQRLVEHVICHLTSGVTAATRVVPQEHGEIIQSWLVFRERIRNRTRFETAAGVDFAVERPVIFENEAGNCGSRQRARFHVHRDRRLARCDGSAAHGVTATVVDTLPGRSGSRIAITRNGRIRGGAGIKGIGGIGGQHRNVVNRRPTEGVRGRQAHIARHGYGQ